ncbi:hypothetical protein CYMTET_45190 [Cymbomonas tetramitiformis]|uniref:Kinesin-like protein n=1 Tax=Cymbomonas tetramitiformis TaxID=36881 RepID=A0AAE0BYQ7_9CHLO|nr:hypothetical protein CYMTET_45190 [Cymbomonas tetramitiformis]
MDSPMSELAPKALFQERAKRGAELSVLDRIRLTVRFRPDLPNVQNGAKNYPPPEMDDKTVTVHRRDGAILTTRFEFDKVLPPSSTQEDVYSAAAADIVDGVMDGYNGAVLAYGQTGAGKTHTLFSASPECIGLVPRAASQLFCQAAVDENFTYQVSLSFIQVYMESIQDLLRPEKSKLAIRDTGKGKGGSQGVYVDNMEEVEVNSMDECISLLQLGDRNRSVAFTDLNAHSSRSHAVVIFTVRKWNRLETQQKTAVARNFTVGKLYLVDLAGSERLKRSGSQGLRANEARSINLSLTVLGKCINARANPNSSHIPFRDSKLTRILQDCLSENSRTSLICCAYPGGEHGDETLSTLQFGERAMEVKLAASQNIGQDYRPKAPMLSPRIQAQPQEPAANLDQLVLPKPPFSAQELEAISDADSVAPSSPLSKHLHLELELKLERQRSHQLEEELSKTREELLQEAALRRRELAQQEDACQQRMRELEAVARTRLEEVEHTVRCAISGGGDGPATPVAGPTVQDAEGKMDGVAQAEQRMALMASRIDDMITSPAHGFAQNRLITQKAAAAAKIQMQWLRHRGRRRELQAQERDSMAQQRGKALEDLVAETETTTKQYLASTGRALIAQSILSIDRATDASLRMFLVPRKKLNR